MAFRAEIRRYYTLLYWRNCSNWLRTKAHTLALTAVIRACFFLSHRVWSSRASQAAGAGRPVLCVYQADLYIIWADYEHGQIKCYHWTQNSPWNSPSVSNWMLIPKKFGLRFASRETHNQWTWGELKRNGKCFLHNSRTGNYDCLWRKWRQHTLYVTRLSNITATIARQADGVRWTVKRKTKHISIANGEKWSKSVIVYDYISGNIVCAAWRENSHSHAQRNVNGKGNCSVSVY